MLPTVSRQTLDELIADVVRRAVRDELTAFYTDQLSGLPSWPTTVSLPRRAYTVAEVAQMIGRTPKAVYAMVKRGQLHGVQDEPGGRLTIPIGAVEDFLRGAE